MNRKTIIWLCVVAILVDIIQCQVAAPSPCLAAMGPEPPIETLKADSKSDPLPRGQMLKLMKEDKKLAKEIAAARKLPVCFKIKPVLSSTVSASAWTNTCPVKWHLYYIPRKVWYQPANKYCWVLPPWRNTYCRYARCRYTYCQNVVTHKAAAAGGPGIVAPPHRPRCFRTNYKVIVYFILCPNPWRIYKRSIRLPMSCSCRTC